MESGSTMTNTLCANTPPQKTTLFTIASPESELERDDNDCHRPREDEEEEEEEEENPNKRHIQNQALQNGTLQNQTLGSETPQNHRNHHLNSALANQDLTNITNQNQRLQEQPDDNGSGTSQESPQQSLLDREERSSGEDNSKDTEDAVEHESSDLTFKKKDVTRSRTQSFQLVLSTASLKSLKLQVINNPVPPSASNRNNSIITTAGSSNTNMKNFQSFIQAPVLSSISNLKTDDIEIGQQLPFNDTKSNSGSDKSHDDQSTSSPLPNSDSNDEDDQDTIILQQNLTLNALKKLSLSPMFMGNKDQTFKKLTRKPSQKRVDTDRGKVAEPYQPAEVDLSLFASLTRQPKMNTTKREEKSDNDEKAMAEKEKLTRLEENSQENALTKAQQEYHKELRNQQISHIQKQQPQLTLQNSHASSKIPAAVIPPQSMNTRRQSSHLPSQSNSSHPQPYLLNFQPQQNHQSPYKPPQNPQHPQNHHQQIHQQSQHQSAQVSVSLPQTQNAAKVNKQLQQIKGLRSPMYVPAVLRLTHRGSSPTNMNVSSSINSNASTPGDESTSPKTQGIESTLHALQYHNELEPRSSTSSVRLFDSGLSVDSTASGSVLNKTNYLGSSKKNYEDILKAPPTRKHWVKDEVVFKCSIPSCNKVFNFFERRHHCRKCGGIYCKEHTSHYLYINHMAQFTTGGRGTLSKVCDLCISEYNDFIQHEFGVSISNSRQTTPVARSEAEQEQEIPKLEYRPTGIKSKAPFEKKDRAEQLVGSVPANWSWSSF